jgi:hypothetical protein
MLRKNKINVIPEFFYRESILTSLPNSFPFVIPAFFSFCHSRMTLLVRQFLRRSGNPLLLLWMPYPPSKMADKLNYSGVTTLLILALLSKDAVLRNIS